MLPTLLSDQAASGLAYLDGGTGSLLIQAALAGIVTSAYFVKTKWQLLKAMISRKNTPPSEG